MTRISHAQEIADARFWAEHARPDMAQADLGPDPRPPLLRRLVWPGVLACVVGLLALGVM